MDNILKIRDEELELNGVDSGGSPMYNFQGKPFTGIRLLYENTTWLAMEEEFQNGYLEGWVRFYYESGQLEKEYKLHNNVVVADTFKSYDESGKFTGGF